MPSPAQVRLLPHSNLSTSNRTPSTHSGWPERTGLSRTSASYSYPTPDGEDSTHTARPPSVDSNSFTPSSSEDRSSSRNITQRARIHAKARESNSNAKPTRDAEMEGGKRSPGGGEMGILRAPLPPNEGAALSPPTNSQVPSSAPPARRIGRIAGSNAYDPESYPFGGGKEWEKSEGHGLTTIAKRLKPHRGEEKGCYSGNAMLPGSYSVSWEYEIRPNESAFAVVSLPSSSESYGSNTSLNQPINNGALEAAWQSPRSCKVASTNRIDLCADFRNPPLRGFPARKGNDAPSFRNVDARGIDTNRETPFDRVERKNREDIGGESRVSSFTACSICASSSRPSSSTCGCACACCGGSCSCSTCSCASCGYSTSESVETLLSSSSSSAERKSLREETTKKVLFDPKDLPIVPKLLTLPPRSVEMGLADTSFEAPKGSLNAVEGKAIALELVMKDECLQTSLEEVETQTRVEEVPEFPRCEVPNKEIQEIPLDESSVRLSADLQRLSCACEVWFERHERHISDALVSIQELITSEWQRYLHEQSAKSTENKESGEGGNEKAAHKHLPVLYAMESEAPRPIYVDCATSPISEEKVTISKAIQTIVSAAEEEARTAECFATAHSIANDAFRTVLGALEEEEIKQREFITEMEANFRVEGLYARHSEVLRVNSLANQRLQAAQNEFSAQLISQQWRQLIQLQAFEMERQERLLIEAEEASTKGELIHKFDQDMLAFERRESARKLQEAEHSHLELEEGAARLRSWQQEAIVREKQLREKLLYVLRLPTATLIQSQGKSFNASEDTDDNRNATACGGSNNSSEGLRRHERTYHRNIEELGGRDLAVHLRFARAHQEAIRAVRAEQRRV